jgi:UDPglucose--hexose-1-phosphate uridylyltransferase
VTRSTLRVDVIRGWPTIVAPVRGRRPFDAEGAVPSTSDTSGCPFCPGAEDELGEILAESAPLDSGEAWGVRAVRNRYPFLGSPDAPREGAHALGGLQEVLIDGPAHDVDPQDQTAERRRAVLDMWCARIDAARGAGAVEVHLFRNHGRDAGSSRRHPHAQLVATNAATPARRAMLERLDAVGGSGGCLLCEDGEPGAAERLVFASGAWRVATLHAPLDPCHVRIVPARHVHSLTALDATERDELADLLGRLPRAAERVLGPVAWTLLAHDLGGRGPGRHLHLEFRPRLTRLAGFEQSSGIGVCPSDPIDDAAALRHALEAHAPASHTSAPRSPGPPPNR